MRSTETVAVKVDQITEFAGIREVADGREHSVTASRSSRIHHPEHLSQGEKFAGTWKGIV